MGHPGKKKLPPGPKTYSANPIAPPTFRRVSEFGSLVYSAYTELEREERVRMLKLAERKPEAVEKALAQIKAEQEPAK